MCQLASVIIYESESSAFATLSSLSYYSAVYTSSEDIFRTAIDTLVEFMAWIPQKENSEITQQRFVDHIISQVCGNDLCVEYLLEGDFQSAYIL